MVTACYVRSDKKMSVVENEIRSRDEAIEWVGIYLEKSEGE